MQSFPTGFFDITRAHFAKMDDANDIKRADYYKRSAAGYKANNTRLKNQLIKKSKLWK